MEINFFSLFQAQSSHERYTYPSNHPSAPTLATQHRTPPPPPSQQQQQQQQQVISNNPSMHRTPNIVNTNLQAQWPYDVYNLNQTHQPSNQNQYMRHDVTTASVPMQYAPVLHQPLPPQQPQQQHQPHQMHYSDWNIMHNASNWPSGNQIK
jgi:hypothetical protein